MFPSPGTPPSRTVRGDRPALPNSAGADCLPLRKQSLTSLFHLFQQPRDTTPGGGVAQGKSMARSIGASAASPQTLARKMPPQAGKDTLVAAPTRRGESRTTRKVVPSWACLLVSEDEQRRRRFASTAEAAGWSAISCGSIGEAMQQAARWRTQLAVIDLGHMAAVQKSAYLQYAAKIATREALLLVSDEPSDSMADAELLSRQAGAWLYLASPEFGEGLTDLFAQARHLAEKIAAETPPIPVRKS